MLPTARKQLNMRCTLSSFECVRGDGCDKTLGVPLGAIVVVVFSEYDVLNSPEPCVMFVIGEFLDMAAQESQEQPRRKY
jgi:hypothetical protein